MLEPQGGRFQWPDRYQAELNKDAAAMISRLVPHTESFLMFWRWSGNE